MFRASLCPSSGDQDVCYCEWCTALVLLDVVGSGCGALRCGGRVLSLAPYNAVPHNRYQPHPAEPAQHTTCSNTRLGLLRMGIMMRETCWECVDNKHLTVASCWFSLSLLNRNLFPFFICAIYSHNSPTISRPVLSCTRVTCTDICHVLDKIFPPVLGSCLSMVVAVSCSFENGKSW